MSRAGEAENHPLTRQRDERSLEHQREVAGGSQRTLSIWKAKQGWGRGEGAGTPGGVNTKTQSATKRRWGTPREGQAARLALAERREPTALRQDGAIVMTTFAEDNLPK